MSHAARFRDAYLAARAAGYSGTRRAFADLVLTTDLFRREVRIGAAAWVRESPEPETTQARLAGLQWAGLDRQDGPYLRVISTKETPP